MGMYDTIVWTGDPPGQDSFVELLPLIAKKLPKATMVAVKKKKDAPRMTARWDKEIALKGSRMKFTTHLVDDNAFAETDWAALGRVALEDFSKSHVHFFGGGGIALQELKEIEKKGHFTAFVYDVRRKKDGAQSKDLLELMKALGGDVDASTGVMTLGDYQLVGQVLDTPRYWVNRAHTEFGKGYTLGADIKAKIDQLFHDTFMQRITKDRRGVLPTKLSVQYVERIEDSRMWIRYMQERNFIKRRRKSCKHASMLPDGTSRPVKTMQRDQSFQDAVEDEINELYLWHGSTPEAISGISEYGFQVKRAGSHRGTLFGNGAYLAECSSKADEYASPHPSTGLCAMLLCRVVLGEMFYTQVSDVDGIERAIGSGQCDSVLGDRELAVGTYREFVAFRETQVYPEYIVNYIREYE